MPVEHIFFIITGYTFSINFATTQISFLKRQLNTSTSDRFVTSLYTGQWNRKLNPQQSYITQNTHTHTHCSSGTPLYLPTSAASGGVPDLSGGHGDLRPLFKLCVG